MLRSARTLSGKPVLAMAIWVKPETTVSRFLKSWAMPPAKSHGLHFPGVDELCLYALRAARNLLYLLIAAECLWRQ
jgi:hypothetical protein